MEWLNRLKSFVWSNEDADEEYDQPRHDQGATSAAPCTGKVILVKADLYVNVGLLSSYLCAGYMVVMDLSGVTGEGARRIVDFLSGAAYSRNGQLLQISCKAYLLAPSTVNISDWNQIKGDDWEYGDVLNF